MKDDSAEIYDRVGRFGKLITALGAGSYALRFISNLGTGLSSPIRSVAHSLPFVGDYIDAPEQVTTLGLNAAQWGSLGQILVIVGIVIMIYKWLLKSGIACSAKELIVGIGKVVASGLKTAWDGVTSLARGLMSWVKSLVSKGRDPGMEGEHVLQEWRRVNMATHVCVGGLI